MAIKKFGHQWLLSVVVPYTSADLVTAVAAALAQIPANGIVVGGGVAVQVACDATACTADVGDTADPNRYTASPVNLKVVGYTALTLTGFQYTAPTDVNITPTITGANTVGSGAVVINYAVDGRANEVSR